MAEKTQSPLMSSRGRILVVDDEPNVLETIGAILERDFDVVTCSSGLEAIEILRNSPPFHLVCTDFEMPTINGVSLLHHVSRSCSYTGCLLISGSDQYIRYNSQGDYYVLLKPLNPERFLNLVSQFVRVAEMKRSRQIDVTPAVPAPPSSKPVLPISTKSTRKLR